MERCADHDHKRDSKGAAEHAEYEGEAWHWCAKHICWVDDTTCFDGCKDFHGRKLDGDGQDARKGEAECKS